MSDGKMGLGSFPSGGEGERGKGSGTESQIVVKYGICQPSALLVHPGPAIHTLVRILAFNI